MGIFGRTETSRATEGIRMRFPVLLRFQLKSEELWKRSIVPDGRLIELSFEKYDTWVCPPNIGFTIGGPFGMRKVEHVIIVDDGVICDLSDLVAPMEKLIPALAKFKEDMSNAKWRLMHEFIVAD